MIGKYCLTQGRKIYMLLATQRGHSSLIAFIWSDKYHQLLPSDWIHYFLLDSEKGGQSLIYYIREHSLEIIANWGYRFVEIEIKLSCNTVPLKNKNLQNLSHKKQVSMQHLCSSSVNMHCKCMADWCLECISASL